MDDGVVRALAEARALGFLGPGELDAHLRSAAAFEAAIGELPGAARALDLGSGGGVPGLLLAARYVDVHWVLLDANRRRTSFLARTVAALGWGGRVEVLRAAAEEAGHDAGLRSQFDLVVSRSFGPPPSTAECAAAFLRVGGRLCVAEPPMSTPGRWPADGLASLGLAVEEEGGAVAVLRQVAAPPVDVARSWKALERRPRW